MASIEYTYLQNLRSLSQISWRIKVQASRQWNDYNSISGLDRGLHRILVDEYVRYFKNLFYFFT